MFKRSNHPKEISFIHTMNQVAYQLRQQSTKAEDHLWKYLRKNRLLGYKFRRQFAIGKYIVDFICCDQKLIIEVDGLIHLKHIDYDQQRDHYLQEHGYQVLRFSNEAVIKNTKRVLVEIASLLKGGGGPANGGDEAGYN